ncbi:MAG TPA: hypothetical protein GX497_10965 [Bacillus bacterium]|nr:hypothetical protein [Bacillus sp. (in: firmicutes)]
MNNFYDITPEEVCAVLTIQPVPKHILPQLDYDDLLRQKVIHSLSETGYEFIDDSLAGYYDARLKKEIRSTRPIMDQKLSGNQLNVSHKAVIVILWCLLVLPRIDPMIRKELRKPLTVAEDQLYENFKQHIGAKKNLKRIITILRKQQFLEYSSKMKAYIAGPRLFTAIDSNIMYERVKTHMIHFLVTEQEKQRTALNTSFQNYALALKEDEANEQYKNA